MTPPKHVADLLAAEEISSDQERAMLERSARRVLGIGADEFEQRWRSGFYRNCEDPRVTDVAFYLR